MVAGKKVKLNEVQFYFDGVLRDALDSAALSRRSSDWLHLRSKLMSLDQESYEIAIASIKNLVGSLHGPEEKAPTPGWQDSKDIYGQIRKQDGKLSS